VPRGGNAERTAEPPSDRPARRAPRRTDRNRGNLSSFFSGINENLALDTRGDSRGARGAPPRARLVCAARGSRAEKSARAHFFSCNRCRILYKQLEIILPAAATTLGRKGVLDCALWADTCWWNSTVVTQTH
jgi:hypothetical protein